MRKIFISIHPFSPSAAIRVSGQDASEFLQGQFTNDLRIPGPQVTYGLWLNQRGKVVADSQILKISEREFLLTSPSSAAAVISQRLEQYIIADDVTLDDQTSALQALTMEGNDVAKILRETVGEPPAIGRFSEGRGVMIFGRPRAGAGFDVLGPRNLVQGLLKDFLSVGCTEINDSEAEFARIKAGTPLVPNDIGPADLPQEAGLERTAISFTKGCYLGQEVMARLKSMGQVRRQLRRVRGDGPSPASGALLFQQGKKIGEIRSAIAAPAGGFVALAMLTRMGLDENAGFTFAPSSEAAPVVSLWTT